MRTQKTPAKSTPDMDTQMLFGCSGFVVASVMSYALVVWPHFLWRETHQIEVLVRCLLVGLVPAAFIGLWTTRRFGLAGAAGFFGGAIAGGTFLFLRIQQVMAFKGIWEAPQPEYPTLWMWLVPGIWLLLAALIILIFLPKGELSAEPTPAAPTERE